MYDLIIIGGGPAGMTAAIYAKRANLNVAIIEKSAPGGQMVNTSVIENYPGKKGSGADIAFEMYNQTAELGVEFIFDEVKSIKDMGLYKDIYGEKMYSSKAIIVASGMRPRSLHIKNEESFIGKGISWCAICDGSFYKMKDVAVIGGGNSALEEALYLSNICKHVSIIQRSSLRAEASIQDAVRNKENIDVYTNTSPIEFVGNGLLEGIIVNDGTQNREIKVSGVFVYIGYDPMTDFLDKSILDEKGFILVDQNMQTSIKGIYAAGDCIKKNIRQVVTATNDGAIAAINASKYVKE